MRSRWRVDVRDVHVHPAAIVVNKPPGVLSVPLERNRGVPSVFDQLEDRFRSHGKRRPLVVFGSSPASAFPSLTP